ncbi:MAG: glutathione synthase [Deltaproteobacteria bacterium RBG_13_61_14]|nr:MAG: glutathione synthase [Deltaproteobacteria bacterium RBG_13_61_14]
MKNSTSYRLAFFMDPLPGILPDKDTTFALMLEAQKRGHQVLYFTPAEMRIQAGRPWAALQEVEVFRPKRPGQPHFRPAGQSEEPLAKADMVLMRVDPPVTIEYVLLTQFLDLIPPPTVVVNRPVGLRTAGEKLFTLHSPDLIPPTIISRRIAELKDFLKEVGGKMVVKPINARGGDEVFIVEARDPNLNVILEAATRYQTRFTLAQKYLPAAKKGDKRIIVLSGEPIGATLRVPQAGEHRANIHVGGTCRKAEITRRDREICARLAPSLRSLGLHLVGLDVIGGFLTEVNVTSPTGVQEIDRLDHVCLEERIWDYFEWLVQTAKQASKPASA